MLSATPFKLVEPMRSDPGAEPSDLLSRAGAHRGGRHPFGVSRGCCSRAVAQLGPFPSRNGFASRSLLRGVARRKWPPPEKDGHAGLVHQFPMFRILKELVTTDGGFVRSCRSHEPLRPEARPDRHPPAARRDQDRRRHGTSRPGVEVESGTRVKQKISRRAGESAEEESVRSTRE